MSEKVAIKTPDFEGPIEMLLRLVQGKKMQINDVSLALVTDDYIAKVAEMGTKNYSEATHFISIASTLILIKSKSLLPTVELTEEENDNIEELEIRLKLYEAIQMVSSVVSELYGRDYMYARPYRRSKKVFFLPDAEKMQVDVIANMMSKVIDDLPVVKLPTVQVGSVVRMEEMIEGIKMRIQSGLAFSLKEVMEDEVLGDYSNPGYRMAKLNAVVGFLSILEMARNGLVSLYQEGVYGDIIVKQPDN